MMNFLMQKKSVALGLLTWIFLSSAAGAQNLGALIKTDKGDIEIVFNEQLAPTSVANFVNLAQRGFYDGLKFHRVERNFMIQGGDPLGTGTGSPGYRFSGEVTLRHNRAGILSTANSGPGTDGSQFFITHVPAPHLDGKHSVFGRVVKGQEVVNAISRGDVIQSVTINGDTAALMRRKRADLGIWNAALDVGFPDLKPAASELVQLVPQEGLQE
jgi:peptidyl-prolyl cis-trans isomerase B (cyclophilin B)